MIFQTAMKNEVYIALALIMTLYSCNTNQPATNDEVAMSDVSILNLNESKSDVELHGDTLAYNTLALYYFSEGKYNEMLYYSMIMANKFGYDNAYYDVYQILIDIYGDSISQIDTLTAYMALSYLTTAAKKGFSVAQEEVHRYNVDLGQNNKAQIIKMHSD
jgi:hypothetical protein